MINMDSKKMNVFPIHSDLTNTPDVHAGILPKEHYDLIVFSPAWRPEDVLQGNPNVQITCRGAGQYLVISGELRIAWVCTGLCGGVMDSVLSIAELDCSRVLFLDQATALNQELKAGSLIVPNKVIHGGDPLQYLEPSHEELDMEARRTPPRGVMWINKAAYQQNIHTNTRIVFSCQTRMAVQVQMEAVLRSGAEAMDQYSSLFSRCMAKMGCNGATLLVVSQRLGRSSGPEERAHVDWVLREDVSRILLALAAERVKVA